MKYGISGRFMDSCAGQFVPYVLASCFLLDKRGARGAEVSQKCCSAPGVRLWGLAGRGLSLLVLILLFLFLYV